MKSLITGEQDFQDSKEEIKIKDLASKLFEIADFKPEFDIQPAPESCVLRRCPDISKLKQLTGFKPRVNLEEGLQKTYDWYKQNHFKNE